VKQCLLLFVLFAATSDTRAHVLLPRLEFEVSTSLIIATPARIPTAEENPPAKSPPTGMRKTVVSESSSHLRPGDWSRVRAAHLTAAPFIDCLLNEVWRIVFTRKDLSNVSSR
jgi:hypothetical protein